MNARIPAEVFPPGEYLKDELEARNWTQVEFAEIIGKDTRLVYEIINAKRGITPETAIVLSEALSTSPELWMNLESQYQLSKVRNRSGNVSRKAELHSKFPVRELIKRGWIEATTSLDVLEQQLLDFFGLKDISEDSAFSYAGKQHSYSETSVKQLAWLCKARELALSAPAKKFIPSTIDEVIERLQREIEFVDGARNVASILGEAGIRFVILEPLPGTKIDGACFWLGKNSTQPVVAHSLRFDRIDNFWHTLMHELDHIRHGEGKEAPILEEDILVDSDEKPEMERRANEEAAKMLVPHEELIGFIARLNPMFSDKEILGFSKRLHVHPGIVVGQLQNRKLIKWNQFRKRLEKVREFVVPSAITDGYGNSI